MHASWVNRGEKGLSLRESAEFDVRDALLLEEEMKQFQYGKEISGQGPSIVELKQRWHEREVHAARQSGADLLSHGVTIDDPAVEISPLTTSTEDGCQPPARKRKDIASMFKSRLDAATSCEMKIREIKVISSLRKTTEVANSRKGKTNYVVDVANSPSCTCMDFEKNKSKVLCKHIIFVIAVALDGMNFADTLKTRYFGDAELS